MLKIENELLTARINPVGAELSSLIKKDTEREYIWQAEPSVWGRHAPLLFPAVGRMSGDSFIYDGKKYFMQKHGFLRGSSFEVVEKTDNSALLRFSSNEKTLMSFPFEFDFDAEYSLSESALVQRLTVTNKGDGNMYFSVGAHPAFNIRIGDTLRFETPEHATLPYLDGNDTVGNPESKLILDGETDIVLSKELFENGSLALEAPASTYAELVGSDGVPYLRETFGKTPMLWLWAKPGAEFVCIEPWSGSDERVPTEELENKKGILCLAPSQSFILPVDIKIL